MRTFILSCACILALASATYASRPITADQITAPQPLLPYCSWLSDPEGTQTIESVTSGTLQQRFAPLQGAFPLKEQGPVWIRLVIVKTPMNTPGGVSSQADTRLSVRLGDLPAGETTLYASRAPGQLGAPGGWHAERVYPHETVDLPEPGLLPVSVYIRMDETPGLWFAPVISARNAMQPDVLPSELILPGLFIAACAACLLRALAEKAQWALWSALFLLCALAQTLLPLPGPSHGFLPEHLPALLAPGMALILLPHVGRCMFRSVPLSPLQDGLLYLCSLTGVAVALGPLIPGFAWLTRLFPLWPLLLIPLLPVCIGALAARRPGSLAFSGACFMPVLGAGITLYTLFHPSLHPLASQGSLWGLAVGGLGLVLARVPLVDKKTAAADTVETPALAGLTLAESAADAARAQAADNGLKLAETSAFTRQSQYDEMPPLEVLHIEEPAPSAQPFGNAPGGGAPTGTPGGISAMPSLSLTPEGALAKTPEGAPSAPVSPVSSSPEPLRLHEESGDAWTAEIPAPVSFDLPPSPDEELTILQGQSPEHSQGPLQDSPAAPSAPNPPAQEQAVPEQPVREAPVQAASQEPSPAAPAGTPSGSALVAASAPAPGAVSETAPQVRDGVPAAAKSAPAPTLPTPETQARPLPTEVRRAETTDTQAAQTAAPGTDTAGPAEAEGGMPSDSERAWFAKLGIPLAPVKKPVAAEPPLPAPTVEEPPAPEAAAPQSAPAAEQPEARSEATAGGSPEAGADKTASPEEAEGINTGEAAAGSAPAQDGQEWPEEPEWPEWKEEPVLSLVDEGLASFSVDMQQELEAEAARHSSFATEDGFLFSLHSLVREVHNVVAPLAQSKGLVFSWYISPLLPSLLEGDAPRLRGALTLLLQNAVLATRKGAVQLAVRKTPGSPDPGDLLFVIHDSGSAQRTEAGFFHAWEMASRTGGIFNVEYSPLNGTEISFTVRFALPSEQVADELLDIHPPRSEEEEDEFMPVLSSILVPADGGWTAVTAPEPADFEDETWMDGLTAEQVLAEQGFLEPLPDRAPAGEQPEDILHAGISEETGDRSDAGPDRPRTGAAENAASGIRRIVAAEMTTSNRRLLAHFLSGLPHEHINAATNPQVLDIVRAGPVSLIIFDGDTPEHDIIRTLRAIRTEERKTAQPPTPVLVMTSHEAQSARFLDGGASYTLLKPVRQEELAALAAGTAPVPPTSEDSPGRNGPAPVREVSSAPEPDAPGFLPARSGATAPADPIATTVLAGPATAAAHPDADTTFSAARDSAASPDAPPKSESSAEKDLEKEIDLLALALRDAPKQQSGSMEVSLPPRHGISTVQSQTESSVLPGDSDPVLPTGPEPVESAMPYGDASAAAPMLLGLSLEDVTPAAPEAVAPKAIGKPETHEPAPAERFSEADFEPVPWPELTPSPPAREGTPVQPEPPARTASSPAEAAPAADLTARQPDGQPEEPARYGHAFPPTGSLLDFVLPDAPPEPGIPDTRDRQEPLPARSVTPQQAGQDAPEDRDTPDTPAKAEGSGEAAPIRDIPREPNAPPAPDSGEAALAGGAERVLPEESEIPDREESSPAEVDRISPDPAPALSPATEQDSVPVAPEPVSTPLPEAEAPAPPLEPQADASLAGDTAPGGLENASTEAVPFFEDTSEPARNLPEQAEAAPSSPEPEPFAPAIHENAGENDAAADEAAASPDDEARAHTAHSGEADDAAAGSGHGVDQAAVDSGIADSAALLPEDAPGQDAAGEESAPPLFFPLPGLEGEFLDATVMPLTPGLIHSLQDITRDIQHAAEHGQSILVQEASGRLAGKSENFGLIKLGKIARCVERAAEADDLEAVATLLEDLVPVVGRYMASLQECFNAFMYRR